MLKHHSSYFFFSDKQWDLTETGKPLKECLIGELDPLDCCKDGSCFRVWGLG